MRFAEPAQATGHGKKIGRWAGQISEDVPGPRIEEKQRV